MNGALIRSLLTLDNPWNSTEEVISWLAQRNREVEVDVIQVPFRRLKGWHFDRFTGNLCHDSGKFFSIVGIDVYKNQGRDEHWQQAIISQPEVGYLGIICREMGGVMYFLLQAKIEPGNVNCVQLSPTLQATRSNYTCVHGGKKPAYLDYFKNVQPEHIVLDQLQSEQGARFFRKRNRNIIIQVDEEIELGPDFKWLTLGQIKYLMGRDNTVNMDTRTVLSGLRFEGISSGDGLSEIGVDFAVSEQALSGIDTVDGVLHKFSALKSQYELLVDKIPLKDVAEWAVSDMEIARPDHKYFRIIGVDVTIANREVATWCQPIVQPMHEGLCVLFMKKINGVLHFLLQAKVECGNFDVVEFAPTIQCLTGDYRSEPIERRPKYLMEFLAGTMPGRIVFDTFQSEEGGRFYHEQNRNQIFLIDENATILPDERYIWLTLGQIKEFLRYNNYLNIQIRSLISVLDYM